MTRQEPVSKHLQELERSQWLLPDEIKMIQFEKMKGLIRHAYENIPHYQTACQQNNISWEDIITIDDWKKLPLLTKDDLRNKASQLVAKNYNGQYSKKTTGGSTGQAVTITKDRNATAYLRAAMWRGYNWHGVDIGDKQARFWGVPLTYWSKKKYQLIDLAANRMRLSAFKFNDDEMLTYYNRLIKFKPLYFYGYVSAIVVFAEFINRHSLDPNRIGVKVIITTAETLHDYHRSYIAKTFQCDVKNEYGCGEVGPIVMECPRNGLHINADNLFVEFLDNEEKTDIKEMVITELNSYMMPLIRYRIKDYALLSHEKCSCGRGLPLVTKITGRAYDWIVSETGKYFHGEYFMYLLEEMKRKNMGVQQFQIIQYSKSEIKIRIVKDGAFSHKTVNYITNHFNDALGEHVKLVFEYLTHIPREKSGKLRLIISHVS